MTSATQPLWICTNCGFKNNTNPLRCPACGWDEFTTSMTPTPQPQQHEWFCCEDCEHDEQGTCPVPEKVIKNISDLKKFQTIVKVTGCKHQESIRFRPTPSPKTWESCREHFTCLNGEECWFLSEDYWRDQIQQAAAKARNATLNEIVIVANFEQNRPITPFMISGWCNKLRTPTSKEHP